MKRQRQDSRQAVQVPLVVLAGLPHPISAAVARTVEATLRTKVISHPSGNDDRHLYADRTLSALINAVSGFAVRHLKSQTVPPRPKHIILAYVPAGDDERLLAEFEFFVFPVRLNLLADYDDHGRQHRHSLKTAEEYVVSSLQTALREFAEVRRRLSNISDKEPLFLPPQNFRVSRTERLADLFGEILRQRTSWADPLDSIKRVTVTSEGLPRHIRFGMRKTVLSDVRGLLFPHDPSGHGSLRELPESCSDDERKDIMRSSFRFGVPLRNGFHHDVQFAGRNLGGERFECCRQGSLELSSSHANVYPNDYVRASEE
jgi:hypothetical protein